MKVPMGPPPMKAPMGPPSMKADDVAGVAAATEIMPEPPVDAGVVVETSNSMLELTTAADSSTPKEPEPVRRTNTSAPYSVPPWSEAPVHPFFLEVLRDGSIIEQLDISAKGAYMFGRVDLCDFVLEHPTISRFHAVLQFKGNEGVFLYDLGSTHGSFINKKEVKKRVYTDLHVGDVVRFGQSSRLYIFQGPSELMPPESDLKMQRKAKMQEEMEDREASLGRAKLQASLAEGVSWGMSEDAIEEDTEDEEEITWQTHKGHLTERQGKLREKVMKRMEKIAHMKKEIDAIRAKDISQGGLTQGQQTQIARNEQRTSQIMEELESLEETLNDSIRESLGARGVKNKHGAKKGVTEEEDDGSSDEDEFYDRTNKKRHNLGVEHKQVETADSLLDKKEAIMRDMEEKSNLLLVEKNKIVPETSQVENGDALDAYMTGLSSKLVMDSTTYIEKEISSLQSELDRVLYLLKIADPSGDAARRRESKMQMETSISKEHIPKKSHASDNERKSDSKRKGSGSKEAVNGPSTEDKPEIMKEKPSTADEMIGKDDQDNGEKVPIYSRAKPMWLGDTGSMEVKDNQLKRAAPVPTTDTDGFIDYKDRKKILDSGNEQSESELSSIENAAPGLIIRKRKEPETTKHGADNLSEGSGISSSDADTTVANAVALLLKHNRRFSGLESREDDVNEETHEEFGNSQTKRKTTRVIGPQKPDFLDANPDNETWVPPQGQSGDGRTLLNERYGY